MGEERPPPDGELVEEEPPWDAWTPAQAAARLLGAAARWCVAGGWALDLFAGQESRPHADLEIAVPAGQFPAVARALAGFDLEVVGMGHRWPPGSPALAGTYQTWVRDRGGGAYRLDIFREPHDGDTWICRRDHGIRRPYDEVIARTPDGIPYLVPEIALLFKARHARDKDNADFTATLPRLSAASRDWLAAALSRVHPGHRWLARLR
ncbi:MAG: hypothetical protein M0030_22915 [Actinomycetota bacterium]|nr:hypothetical protein [Actinomycetota bacterium]